MAEQAFPSYASAFFMRCSETPRHMMLERDAHSNGAKTVTLENKPVDTFLTKSQGCKKREKLLL